MSVVRTDLPRGWIGDADRIEEEDENEDEEDGVS
jgi:hypothetical protein